MARVKYDPEIFDIDRLRAAVAWAEAEAEKDDGQWDQGVWVGEGPLSRGRRIQITDEQFPEYNTSYGPDSAREVKCGSAFCIAGWTCHNEGDKFVAIIDPHWVESTTAPDYAVPRGSNDAYDIGQRAQELLGITTDEANELFAGNNEIRDIKRIARKIARRRGETL